MNADSIRATLAATSALRSRAENSRSGFKLPGKAEPAISEMVGLPLIDALLIVCDHLGHAATRDQLLAALPAQDGDINPVAAPIALARVDLHGAWVAGPIKNLAVPCIAALASGGFCALTRGTSENMVQVQALDFDGMMPVQKFLALSITSMLAIQTSAAAAYAPLHACAKKSLFGTLWQSPQLTAAIGVPSLVRAGLLLSLTMLLTGVLIYRSSLLMSGSLVALPVAALMTGLVILGVHLWRAQRDWQASPNLVAQLRRIFLRGYLRQPGRFSDKSDDAGRRSAHHLVSALRTRAVDLPVAILGLMISAAIVPGWMIEAYMPSAGLLGYSVICLFKQRRRAAALRRLVKVLAINDTALVERNRGDIALDNATVVAEGRAQAILSGITLRIRAGEHIGVIGGLGAGKTSLLLALGGYAALESGRRYIDGQPRATERDPLRSEQISFVADDVTIVDGTLADNILMGRPQPLPGMMDWILRATQLQGSTLSLDQVICESMLSSGERRAIGLARALAGDPPVLLLDDPTAHMDGPGERAFLSALTNDSTRRTIVIATNRQSVLRSMDRILWLDQGKIISDKSNDASLAGTRAA